jgi:eukaryotic-like serine/threonine-protein kinase
MGYMTVMGAEGLLDGRYRLGDSLGRGGMADVYAADDLHLGRQVAVKRYRSGAHGVGLRRFMGEAELLAGLSHPGLLTVFDVGFDGERPFLVMQLAPGGTLRDRLDGGPLPPEVVARLGARLAEVLAYVHAAHIVHRDVKPSNVLFGTGDDCYLADFGIARALGAAHLTDSAEFVGTAAYLSPEQVVDRDPGPPTDIYALGLVLLECLSGRTEYSGTDVEMAIARLSRPPRVPDTWGREWHSVLSAMTATDPAARPDAVRCAKLLAAIEPATIEAPRVLTVRRNRRVYAGVTGMAAAAAAVALMLTVSPTPTSGTPTSDPARSAPTTTTATEQPRQGTRQGSIANTAAKTAANPVPPAGQAVATQAPPAAAPPAAHHEKAPKANKGKAKGKGKG